MKIKRKINGREVSEEEFDAHPPLSEAGIPMIGRAYERPLRSLGLAVPQSQVQEFNELYQQKGISGARHDADGTCVLDNRDARNAVLELRGVRDNDAGYGDYAGK